MPRAEEDAGRGVAAGFPRVGHEDFLHILQRCTVETTSRNRDCVTALGKLQVRDVDEPVLGELRVHGDEVQQISSGLRSGRCSGRGYHPRWLRQHHAVTNDAQSPRLLGHEHGLVVREGDAPRVHEAPLPQRKRGFADRPRPDSAGGCRPAACRRRTALAEDDGGRRDQEGGDEECWLLRITRECSTS